ncbi:MAG: dTDP-4-dehydrorhamnose reductase [Burkholderiaceae bacterium]
MRILLTGCGGQLGGALLHALASVGEVIAADRSSIDLSKPEQIAERVSALRPELIVNAAAYTDVERAEVESDAAMTVNGASVGQLARAARDLAVPLIHYSSDYVFDGTKVTPYVEEDLPAPLSAYGRSKLEGENQIRAVGCAHLILRTSWVYAATGRNFLTTMLRLAAEREELRVVDDQWGAPTFAGSIATATAELIKQTYASEAARARFQSGDTVHLVDSGVTSWFGFATEIFESAAVRKRVRAPRLVPIKAMEFPTKARRPANSRLSIEKAQTVWSLTVPDWRDALAECLSQMR